jgi:hypothetical protein
MEAYIGGVSTRKVDALVSALGSQSGISKSQVSRICQEIDQQVQAFLARPLESSSYAYVYLDATYLKGRLGKAQQVCSRAVVVAMGVNGPNEPEQRQERCGDELLGQILSISHPSLRRYAAGERRCPDGVATRLHWLALVVEALEGSYNAIGIRRWFARPRQALAGATPLALLEGNWLPEHPGPQQLKALAAATQAGMVAS